MQDVVAQTLAPKFEAVIASPEACAFDYVLYNRGKPPVFVEIKTRYNTKDRYYTLTIDKEKIDRCVKAAHDFNGVFTLVAYWADEMSAVTIDDASSLKVKRQTLRDVRDHMDVDDEVYEIPTTLFRCIGAGHGINNRRDK